MTSNKTVEDELHSQLGGVTNTVRAAVLAVRCARDALEFAAAERRVHDALREEGDGLVQAALLARITDEDFVEEARAAAHSRAREGGIQLRSKGARPTSVRLLGGTTVPLKTLLLLPATPKNPTTPRKKGQRGSSGAGVYPALAALGIVQRATPALREAVARQVAASNSVSAARDTLQRQGIQIDHKGALRLTYAFADAARSARDHDISEWTAAEPAPMAGMNLVVSLDGGRVRIKEPSGGSEERTYDAQWREPKVLTIYVVDEQGKRNRKIPALIDATMGDADQVAALLVGHLRLVGAHQANHVRFIADGGSWIWARTEEIRKAAGIETDNWCEQLDLPHTVAYLGRVIEPLGETAIDRAAWLAEQKTSLLRGDVDEVLAALQWQAEHHALDVHAALSFINKHRDRLCFLFCRADGQPLGSGAVESAIRRIRDRFRPRHS